MAGLRQPFIIQTLATSIATDERLREVLPDTLQSAVQGGRVRQALGYAFRKHVERRFGQIRITRAGVDVQSKQRLWQIESGEATATAAEVQEQEDDEPRLW